MASLLQSFKNHAIYRVGNKYTVEDTPSEKPDNGILQMATEEYPFSAPTSGVSEVNVEVFHFGVVEAYLQDYGYTDFPVDDWENKPLQAEWEDNSDGYDAAKLDYKDIIWIIANWETITVRYQSPPEGAFAAKEAFRTTIHNSNWARNTDSDSLSDFDDYPGLAEALLEYCTFLHDNSNFTDFFGQINEEKKQNILENVVLWQGTLSDPSKLSGTDAFKLDNFRRYVSTYIYNMINPEYVTDLDLSAVEYGYLPGNNVGSYTEIDDEGKILLIDPPADLAQQMLDQNGEIANLSAIQDIEVNWFQMTTNMGIIPTHVGPLGVLGGDESKNHLALYTEFYRHQTAPEGLEGLSIWQIIGGALMEGITNPSMSDNEVAETPTKGISAWMDKYTRLKFHHYQISYTPDGGTKDAAYNRLISENPYSFVEYSDLREVVPPGQVLDLSALEIETVYDDPHYRDRTSIMTMDIDEVIVSYFIDSTNEQSYRDYMLDPNAEDPTFGQFFRSYAYDAAKQFIGWMANQSANIYKAKLFEELYNAKDKDLGPDADLLARAQEALKNAAENIRPPPLDEAELEDDELAALRKNAASQCALLANMGKLANLYRTNKEKMARDPDNVVHGGGNFYKGRFFSVSSKTPSQTFTKLSAGDYHSDQDMMAFLEATPAEQALFVPKIRIQKIYTPQQQHGMNTTNTISVDIPFETYSKKPMTFDEAIDYNEQFTTTGNVFKGGGGGIKSISFDFDGETPATAEKYVKVDLELFFQDFNSLIEKRATVLHDSFEGDIETTFRYLDLIVNPVGTGRSSVPDTEGSKHRNFYDPSFYRIRVEVGWSLADEIYSNNPSFNSARVDKLNRALSKVNKSFMLCALDHEINVNNDGTVNLKISYRGYGDTLLKSNRFNALIPSAEQEEIKSLIDLYHKELETGACTVDQRAEMQASISVLRKQIANQAAARIMKKMMQRGQVHRASIPAQATKQFQRDGNFDKVPEIKTTLDGKLTGLADPLKDFSFFFLGDLLFTALDCQYFADTGKPVTGAQQLKIILCDFDMTQFLPDLTGENNSSNVLVPISSIPIAVSSYEKWFINEILGTERYNMPVMEFIQRFTNDLCGCFLSEICFTKEEDKSIFFRQGNILADPSYLTLLPNIARSYPGGDINLDVEVGERIVDTSFVDSQLNDLQTTQQQDIIAEQAITEAAGMVQGPLQSGASMSSDGFFTTVGDLDTSALCPLHLTHDLHGHEIVEYAVVYVDKQPKHIETGMGLYSKNLENGLLHLNVGADRGLLKTASWSKQNVQYLREARMFRAQGATNYAQLATYYNVTLNMFGNFLLLPGMMFYLDPFGIGGLKFGRPNDPGSDGALDPSDINFSRLMGIGGYHLVTGVKAKITPQKFETTVEGRFVFSGNKNTEGPVSTDRIITAQEDASIDDRSPEERIEDAESCRSVISVAQMAIIQGT